MFLAKGKIYKSSLVLAVSLALFTTGCLRVGGGKTADTYVFENNGETANVVFYHKPAFDAAEGAYLAGKVTGTLKENHWFEYYDISQKEGRPYLGIFLFETLLFFTYANNRLELGAPGKWEYADFTDRSLLYGGGKKTLCCSEDCKTYVEFKLMLDQGAYTSVQSIYENGVFKRIIDRNRLLIQEPVGWEDYYFCDKKTQTLYVDGQEGPAATENAIYAYRLKTDEVIPFIEPAEYFMGADEGYIIYIRTKEEADENVALIWAKPLLK